MHALQRPSTGTQQKPHRFSQRPSRCAGRQALHAFRGQQARRCDGWSACRHVHLQPPKSRPPWEDGSAHRVDSLSPGSVPTGGRLMILTAYARPVALSATRLTTAKPCAGGGADGGEWTRRACPRSLCTALTVQACRREVSPQRAGSRACIPRREVPPACPAACPSRLTAFAQRLPHAVAVPEAAVHAARGGPVLGGCTCSVTR